MNTYTFSSGAKSNIIKAFVIGLVIFVLGIAIKALGGNGDHDHHGDHHGNTLVKTEFLMAETATVHSTDTPTDIHANEAHAADHGHDDGHHAAEASLKTLIVANVYTVVLFAFWISIAALFFLSAATLALGGWQIQIQKIILSVAGTLPFSIAAMALIFVFFNHDIFEWTHTYLFDPEDARFDAILASKADYLNITRFAITAVFLFAMSLAIYFMWRKNLMQQDETPSIALFNKSRALAAASIVLIAMVLNTFGSWDWAMSIQPHWYSTMFSWYMMASAAVSMFSVVMLMIIFLQSLGYLPNVNENHRHDIAKFMFAISVFWTYVWFSQYMLIWYANIPEETIYFKKRLENYGPLFYVTIIINFVIPFLVLLKRETKRKVGIVAVMAVVIIVGHWMDYFSFIVPEIVPNGGFGLIGFGAFVMMASIFAFFTLRTLAEFKDLESSTHPYIRESYQHHI
jgi:hypothetical protein